MALTRIITHTPPTKHSYNNMVHGHELRPYSLVCISVYECVCVCLHLYTVCSKFVLPISLRCTKLQVELLHFIEFLWTNWPTDKTEETTEGSKEEGEIGNSHDLYFNICESKCSPDLWHNTYAIHLDLVLIKLHRKFNQFQSGPL